MIPIDSRIDWNALRAEYQTGNISQQKLADKYGIPYPTLRDRAQREEWRKVIDEQREIFVAKTLEKTADAIADNASIAQDIKKRLLLRLKRIEEKYPADATEVRARQDGKTIVYRLRDLTSAFKDLTDGIPMCEGDKNAPIYELIRKLDNESKEAGE